MFCYWMMGADVLRAVFRSMRMPFLILTPVSVFLGISTSLLTTADIDSFDCLVVLVGALLAHISVNTFNEYYDFRSGLDAMTIKTPFSGGSGALIDNPKAANAVFGMGVTSLILTILIGGHSVSRAGVSIIPLGVVGVLIIITYTHWLNRHPMLCLVAPGLGFGPLMVLGTHIVLTGEYSGLAIYVSLVPFFLANNLLLLNQLPDISADARVGRRHFPIVYGSRSSVVLYAAFALAAGLIVLVGVLVNYLPVLCLACLIPLTTTVAVFFGAGKHAESLPDLIPFLGMNVVATILTPLLLGLGIILG